MKLITCKTALVLTIIFYDVYGEENREGAIVAVDTDDDDDTRNDAVVHSFTDKENLDVFQPTSEWQTIEEGQAIPPGLHVQINLQSGKKQAKLMDGDDGSRYRNHEKTKYFKENNYSKQKFIQIDKKIFSKQHLKDALKDFKDKFHDEKPEEDKKENKATMFRPIEEIKKDLEDANLYLKKDIDFIKQHVQTLNNSMSSLEEREHALNELEYYLHQTDNAVDFNTIGGLKLIITLLNSTEERLTATAAYVLGSATQSNPTVQKAAKGYGALILLLRLVSSHTSMAVRRKALYALSSIIRLCPVCQQEFLKMNGLEIFLRLLSETGTGQLKMKIVTLTTDILTEQFDLVKKKAKKKSAQDIEAILKQVPLLKAMVKQGWCKLVPDLLKTTDNDTREKVLHALNIMVVGCREEFKKLNFFTNLDNLQTEWQNIVDKLNNDEAEYFLQLSQLVLDLKSKLN